MKFDNPPALLLIDIQKGLDELDYYGGARNNTHAEERAAELLAFWRKENYPLFHIKHNGKAPSPLTPGKPGNAFKEITKPIEGERVIEKQTNSAFIGTPLHQILQESGITHLVIVGLTTPHCISSTARMAGNLGYTTYVISDATAAFDTPGTQGEKFDADLVHRVSLANLHNEFAMVLDSESLLTFL